MVLRGASIAGGLWDGVQGCPPDLVGFGAGGALAHLMRARIKGKAVGLGHLAPVETSHIAWGA